jgi:hypothetical protein
MEEVPATVRGYQFDPTMTPERKKEKQDERDERARIINLRSQPVDVWCSCHRCEPTENPIEHVCCQDDKHATLLIKEEGIECITLHEGFEVTVLNDYVLQMVKLHLLHVVRDPEKRARLRSGENATKRHLAYINFRTWISNGEKQGKGNRTVTPACVLNKIRSKWPEESGMYTGFRAAQNTLDDL